MNRPYLFRLEWIDGVLSKDVMVAFVSAGLEATTFVAKVAEAIERDLVPDELLIVARETERTRILRSIKSDAGFASLKGRFGKKANATLVTFGADGQEVERLRLWGTIDLCTLPLDDVRRRGGTDLFKIRHGFVPSTATHHFCNPSGTHTERFVRLSNILVKADEIAFLAFCLLPLLPDNRPYCYIDTASLLPVIAAVNDQLRALAPKRAQLLADSFSSYDGIASCSFDHVHEAFVLISASSSGGLARTILAQEQRFAAGNVLHVLFHDEDPEHFPVAIDLRHDKKKNPDGLQRTRKYPSDNCDLCRDGSVPIPLNGEKFDFAGPQNEPLVLKKGHPPKSLLETMSRYGGGKRILRVGRTGSSHPGPRLYQIDHYELLNDTTFGERLTYTARRMVPAGVKKIVYLDEHSRAFAKRLVVACGADIDPEYVTAGDADKITGADPVVIAALIVESGRSLQDVSHDLRTNSKEAPQIFVVGVAKVFSPERLKAIEANLTQTDHPVRHDFAAIDAFVLPRSDSRNAWERELTWLKDPTLRSAKGEIGKWISDRRSLLESNIALIDNLFIGNTEGNQIDIQPGFVFWPGDHPEGSQAEVFYAVSSVLQALRSPKARAPDAIHSNWFQQTILDPENFSRFNDGAVQASLLRAARPEELNFRQDETRSKQLSRILRRVFEASDRLRGAAAMEFMMAIATRRLRLHPKALEEFLVPLSSAAPPRVDFMFNWLLKYRDRLK